MTENFQEKIWQELKEFMDHYAGEKGYPDEGAMFDMLSEIHDTVKKKGVMIMANERKMKKCAFCRKPQDSTDKGGVLVSDVTGKIIGICCKSCRDTVKPG